MTSDGHAIAVAALNERRMQAVKLRLEGFTLAQTAARVGLSPPTIIRAVKSFRAGGWDAVPVRPRGKAASAKPRVLAESEGAIESAPKPATSQGDLDGATQDSTGTEGDDNPPMQLLAVGKAARAALMGQRGAVLWFTGLSGAGKSTIANLVDARLHAKGVRTVMLDGDNIRQGLCRDLGYAPEDRAENIRRVAEVARLMVDAGLVVLAAFISPFKRERQMARSLMEPGEFVEVYVDTPIEVAEQRDPKGLYRKARRGELTHFTGIDSPYETPHDPEVHIQTIRMSAPEACDHVLARLAQMRIIAAH